MHFADCLKYTCTFTACVLTEVFVYVMQIQLTRDDGSYHPNHANHVTKRNANIFVLRQNSARTDGELTYWRVQKKLGNLNANNVSNAEEYIFLQLYFLKCIHMLAFMVDLKPHC